MIQLPEHDWSKANGWVVRNLIEHGNSMVPKVTVESLIDLFGANWRPATEEILTRISEDSKTIEELPEYSIEAADIYKRTLSCTCSLYNGTLTFTSQHNPTL